MFPFVSLNLLAVFLAGLSGYLLGTLWYSPAGFGKTWLASTDLEESESAAPFQPTMLAFGAAMIQSLTLGLVVLEFGARTFLDGASVGLLVGFGLIATSIFSDHLYGRWNIELFLIQAGYRVCFATLVGGILGFWK